jgi:hypothetical protein
MEEVYILQDGSQVDISGYSQMEKTSFLLKNVGAKKIGSTAGKMASVANKRKTILNKDTEVEEVKTPLTTSVKPIKRKNVPPPPSSVILGDLLKAGENFRESIVNPSINKGKVDFNKKQSPKMDVSKVKIKAPGARFATEVDLTAQGTKEEMQYAVDNFTKNQNDAFKYITKRNVEKQKALTDADLTYPYLYYSSYNKEEDDDFVEKTYNEKDLEEIGINPQDFDGYLNKKGFKKDYLDKKSKGLLEGKGRGFDGYDIETADEILKNKYLNMYMQDMQQRDFVRQDLNQEIEVADGYRDKKDIVFNEIFNAEKTKKFIEKKYPTLTKKLKERDAESAEIYNKSKKGGTDFFSWETPGKLAKSGWNAIVDRVAQFSATAYETIGMEDTAEGVRMLDEQNKLFKPNDRGVSYVSGRKVVDDGTEYIVDAKGDIYDADSKIRVTDLFDKKKYDNLVEESKYGESDWMFSVQGAAVQTSGVVADMMLQAALTKGAGRLGAIASSSRKAVAGTALAKPLNEASRLLKKIPLKKENAYAMIAQTTLGYSEGYEGTLQAAREAGINDEQAFRLASNAAQRMAVLYAVTSEINPQTKVADNLFGKSVIKKAIEQYGKKGEKGFVEYIDDFVKNVPKNAIEFAEEGGKEVIQENIQQVGQLGIDRMTNQDAGKKIMNDVMTADDFMNTSILSFVSSGLISKIKMPDFNVKNDAKSDLYALSTLAKNKEEFTKIIDGLTAKNVFPLEQANKLKQDVDIYANNVNKLPKNMPADVAMPIMRDLDKIRVLQDEKKNVDKVFYPEIDEKIDDVNYEINKKITEERARQKNLSIAKAVKAGVVKDIEIKNFATTKELEQYLVDDLGMDAEEAAFNAKQRGFMAESSYLKRKSSDASKIADNKKFIFVNEELSNNAGQAETGQHEFLHGLLSKTLIDTGSQQLLGKALSKELMKMQDAIMGEGSAVPKEFVGRFGLYVRRAEQLNNRAKLQFEAGSISREEYNAQVEQNNGDQWEEALTLYSDALSNGTVKYDEGVFTKLKDVIRQVLQNLGIKNIEFNSGKDVYNFLKDYNKAVDTGYWGKAMKKLGNEGATINKENLTKELNVKPTVKSASTGTKFSLNDKSSKDVKENVNKAYDKEKWSSATNIDGKENKAIDNVLYDILGEYKFTIKGKAKALGYFNLPDFSELDFISETQIAMIPLIRNFNKDFFIAREEYKKELEKSGLDPKSSEFKNKVEAQDEKGYQTKKGIVKENTDLNAYINSQLGNKMKDALKTGNVTSQVFTQDIAEEGFKESRVISSQNEDSTGFDSYDFEQEFIDNADSVYEAINEFDAEQEKLFVLLKDPTFRFVDDKGNPIDIETIPFGSFFITEASDPTVAANRKLKTETDPQKIKELENELKDLERGLFLQQKETLTSAEADELKQLKSFKSYDLSTGMMVNTFKALSKEDTPAKIISNDVAREIIASPNVATLEYRNFKERLSFLSKTMARRMTFKNGPEIESFMYNNWELIYNIINEPVDAVTGQSSYASKKLPPRLKEQNNKGSIGKIKDITRVKFLQSFYGIEDATRIIKKYGGENAEAELQQFEPEEVGEKNGRLWQTAYFDRRTALMELFGDVLVLQEARRLLREPDFLEKIKERNVNLYNELKDDNVRAKVLNDMSKGKSDIVKFSLSEEQELNQNNDVSTFLKGLLFGEQWVVARDIDKAIENGLKENDNKEKNIKDKREKEALLKTLETDAQARVRVAREAARLESLTPEERQEEEDLRKQEETFLNEGDLVFRVPAFNNYSDKAIAYFLISKMAEGYNVFEFSNTDNASGEMTTQVLNALEKQNELNKRNGDLEQAMNAIIEENKGVSASEKISKETAKNKGKNIGKNKIFLPSEDEDFYGLLYTLATGRGKLGEQQMKFLEDKLLHPYTNAMLNLMKARQTMYKDWKDLVNKKHKGVTKLLKKDSGYGGYLTDQAVRVYLWTKAGYEIPGLDKKDIFNLIEVVRGNPKLRAFADDVSLLSKQANGYVEPDSNWAVGSVVGDMNNIISKRNREKYLEVWQSNVDKIFSKDNLSKIESVYGTQYVISLKNMLARMKSGTNRSEGSSDALLNWINGSTAVVMFVNMRSAILQTIGGVNFINTSDNNVFKAGKAMLNPKQYAEDFLKIWNSDYLKDRRSGLMSDVAEAELAQMLNDPRNNSVMDKFKSANYWLLKNGYAPTKFADSFAISFGGAGFYRNRMNTYLSKGMSNEEAEAATMRDFYEVSETNQQSADVSKISMNQASVKGRLILSFQNTPLQYSRIIKKSVIDLVKGRGDALNNISKIVYYSTLQNIFFNLLQNALFALMFDDDDDDEKYNTAKMRAVNGTFDTLLRGSGLKGALLATVKNAVVKWYEKSGDPKGYGDVLLELANVSPAIGIKARAVSKAYKAVEYNKDEIMYKGFSYDNNYAIEALTSLTSASTNLPLDRLYQKSINVSDALNSDFETWQRIAMIMGYSKYSLGLKDYGKPIKIDSKFNLKLPDLKQSTLKLPGQ